MKPAYPSAGSKRRSNVTEDPPSSSDIPVEAVQAELEKILASNAFLRAERLSRFLRYAVERTLQGQGDKLKEYVIGLEVFERRQSYDPRLDAVVRVEARRLRSRLKAYYEAEGRNDSILIDLPKGSYAPTFRKREPPRAAPSIFWRTIGWVAGLLLVVATIYLAVPSSWLNRILPKHRPAGETRPVGPPTALSRYDMSSVAILPFADLSPGKDQEYLCDGMTDELITALTKVEGLRVVAQASSLQFKGRGEDLRQVGEQLRVGTVLKGSVRKAGNKLRLTVQLVYVPDGTYLWSETYEREMKDLFIVQEEISRAIVQKLRIQLAGEQRLRLIRPYTENSEAHNLHLKGRYYWNQRTEEGLRKSVDCFEQAILQDPNFAPAYAALADSHALMASYGLLPPKEVMPKAKAAAIKALQIDDTLAEAHASMAFVQSFYEWDWVEAERAYRRALELNPGYATVHHWYSGCLRALGRYEEALVEIRQAQSLDPLSPAIGRDMGRIFFCMRRYDDAIEQYRKSLELDPDFPSGYLHLGMALVHKSMYDQAVASCQKARELRGANPLTIAGLAHSYALRGNREEARELLNELMELSKRRYVPAFDIALVYIGLGEKDPVFEWLERACENHDGWLAWLNVDPLFDSVRSDPRFSVLLKKVGLARGGSRGGVRNGMSATNRHKVKSTVK